MGTGVGCLFLPNDRDRLLLILSLTVLYPMLCACLFAIFLFWMLPAVLTPHAAVIPAGFWPYGYWLVASLLWVLVLAVLLPLMDDCGRRPLKAVSYKRESGVSIKDSEVTHLKEKGSNGVAQTHAAKAVAVSTALAAYNAVSVSDNSSDHKSCDDSRDGICDANDTVQDAVSRQGSTVSLSDRVKLTQSGEFLSVCFGSVQSEEDLQNNIMRENTSVQVHASNNHTHDSDDDEGDSVDAIALLDSAKSCSDTDSCKDELQDNLGAASSAQSARVEKPKAPAPPPRQQEYTPVEEALDEAMEAVVQTPSSAKAEEVSALRPKSSALPPLNTARASQVQCSAPSSLSPRQSNVVFLYVNSDREETH